MNKRSDFSIVIPAYNEKENLIELLTTIRNNYANCPVIIVDDSKPETSKTHKHLVEKSFSNVSFVSRSKKMGRGSAVLDGIRIALKEKKTKKILEMDADQSHDPHEISRLLKASETYDCVIGSRYLPESSIPNWPIRRRILSKLINFFLKIILDIPVSDFTNGFRCYSRTAALHLVSADLRETGFIALSEWLYILKKKHFSVGEVPTTFTDRKYGTSNAGLAEHINAIRGVIRLRLRSL